MLDGDNFLARQRVLVVTPHADDETLGCAGTLARVKQLGGEVYCLVGSLGGIEQYVGTHGSDDGPPTMRFVSGEERLVEFRSVMDLLGVDGWSVMFDDAYHIALDTLPLRVVIEHIERLGPYSIETLRPTMLLMPATSFNQDHDTVHRACLAATRPSAAGRRHFVPTVLVYDNGTAYWTQSPAPFAPNVYVDVSAFVDVKRKALGLYASQFTGGPGGPGGSGLPSMAHLESYGERIAVPAAEAFQALRIAL